MRIRAQVIIPGLPPSPNELNSLHPLERVKRLSPYRLTANRCAQSARNRAGWPLPSTPKDIGPAPRWIAATMYVRRRYWRDEDHLWTSLTPVVNELKGVLIVDDDFDHVRLYRVDQVDVALAAQERCVLDVWLTSPTIEELEEIRQERDRDATVRVVNY